MVNAISGLTVFEVLNFSYHLPCSDLSNAFTPNLFINKRKARHTVIQLSTLTIPKPLQFQKVSDTHPVVPQVCYVVPASS